MPSGASGEAPTEPSIRTQPGGVVGTEGVSWILCFKGWRNHGSHNQPPQEMLTLTVKGLHLTFGSWGRWKTAGRFLLCFLTPCEVWTRAAMARAGLEWPVQSHSQLPVPPTLKQIA